MGISHIKKKFREEKGRTPVPRFPSLNISTTVRSDLRLVIDLPMTLHFLVSQYSILARLIPPATSNGADDNHPEPLHHLSRHLQHNVDGDLDGDLVLFSSRESPN